MIAIVDYGVGNLASVKKALDHLGHDCAVASDPMQIRQASRIILPGVGHFTSTAALIRLGLQSAIAQAIDQSTPFLGICVGMQWMFAGSEESPATPGLQLFPGNCSRFPAVVKSPHVGWNRLDISSSSKLFRGIPSSSFVYFTHSFRAPINDATVACSEYGGRFSAAVERDHLFGVQFHPEKSGKIGLGILRNFCKL
jgi:imidazole glycerol-phosphate synthase subunit HisH